MVAVGDLCTYLVAAPAGSGGCDSDPRSTGRCANGFPAPVLVAPEGVPGDLGCPGVRGGVLGDATDRVVVAEPGGTATFTLAGAPGLPLGLARLLGLPLNKGLLVLGSPLWLPLGLLVAKLDVSVR